ncbi:D-2-hydroxyacid dehydrogenase [Rheinheimera sediminis]|uniref:D-2-hydroxyacid dehydrogenase n=1 Tax=Rheinheimera sp. YQF-1 TaxID=2499626 RepID=UPI000FDAC4F4|nr:D-2-hydroxyacid dehydrogenase [Rheinheimera sp. YQF-1]RVT45698.1 D-2-hydroxyacid dehydrogenase [Rheinheimera sp. YQF-1]
MKTKVVFLDAATMADTDLTPLQLPDVALTLYAQTSTEQLLTHAKDAQVLISNKVPLDADAIAALPKLRCILVAATGVNIVDLVAAKTAGIVVCNAQGYAGTAVPQHVFALVLQLTNHIHSYHQAVQQAHWSQSAQFCLHLHPIEELADKTMTLVGYGDLGQATGRIAEAFGMKLLIAERPDATELRPGRTAFESAVRQADLLSLHCPLTAATERLINAKTLSWMKATALLINTARGGLIDEKALAEALTTGRLAGAALDVLSTEPPPAEHPLLSPSIPNLLVTPHVAWASRQAMQRLVGQLAENLQAFMRQQPIRQV